jgi:membrane-bound metal-dependent hydrolase YbcI (DUF457 family)
MFLGHFAVGLIGRRLTPAVSLGTWFLAVQLVDLLWPLFLLAGLEHVRIAPGITAFTPLDFYDYPITHSLVGAIVWAMLMAVFSRGIFGDSRIALLLAGGVLSHWMLDVVTHRPDLPVLPAGPHVGLGLWNSIPATLVVELSLFAAALVVYLHGRRRPGVAFWAMIAVLLASYFGAAFGPPPPDVRTLAVSALAVWLFVLWGWWVDRQTHTAKK